MGLSIMVFFKIFLIIRPECGFILIKKLMLADGNSIAVFKSMFGNSVTIDAGAISAFKVF